MNASSTVRKRTLGSLNEGRFCGWKHLSRPCYVRSSSILSKLSALRTDASSSFWYDLMIQHPNHYMLFKVSSHSSPPLFNCFSLLSTCRKNGLASVPSCPSAARLPSRPAIRKSAARALEVGRIRYRVGFRGAGTGGYEIWAISRAPPRDFVSDVSVVIYKVPPGVPCHGLRPA